MKNTLKTLVLAPAVLAAAVLASNVASAEALVKVPFNFTVAGKVCPAGLYSVDRDNIGTMVTLRSKDAPRSFSWVVTPGDPAPTDSRVVLRFDAQGQTHALRNVQYGSVITSRLDKKTVDTERVPALIVQGQ